MFEWDGFFASLLAGLVGEGDIAISNFVQVVRSRSSESFFPNYAAAGQKSEDRSEPPLGALIAWKLLKRKAVQQHLFLPYVLNALRANNDWWWAERACGDLICLGSFNR